jgi:5-hydroxyisourate hydrolase
MSITTHVLDTALGRPARGVPVRLEVAEGQGWKLVGEGKTDDDGRQKALWPSGAPPAAGRYRIRFDTAAYFAAIGVNGFYPYAEVVFELGHGGAPVGHVHVPLLLSPFGYSTYRGS